MASKLGKRVIHFANLPIKLNLPTTFTNIREISLRTIPSATKIEIKRVLESLYGFDVEKVQTLNADGKKKRYGGVVISRPDYKKAYVTLREPLSLNTNLYPIKDILEDMRVKKEGSKKMKRREKMGVVGDEEGEEEMGGRHWMEEKADRNKFKIHKPDKRSDGHGGWDFSQKEWGRIGRPRVVVRQEDLSKKFPWSGMRRFDGDGGEWRQMRDAGRGGGGSNGSRRR